jgi:hypothetical protein
MSPKNWTQHWQKKQAKQERKAERRDLEHYETNRAYAEILEAQPMWTTPRPYYRIDYHGDPADTVRITCCDSRTNGGYCTTCGRGPNDGPITPNRALASNA